MIDDNLVIIYMDNILIFAPDKLILAENTKKVLARLQENVLSRQDASTADRPNKDGHAARAMTDKSSQGSLWSDAHGKSYGQSSPARSDDL